MIFKVILTASLLLVGGVAQAGKDGVWDVTISPPLEAGEWCDSPAFRVTRGSPGFKATATATIQVTAGRHQLVSYQGEGTPLRVAMQVVLNCELRDGVRIVSVQ